MPYIEGLSEEIRRILRGFRITIVFSTINNLGTRLKDPILPDTRPGIIYKIKCICGDLYVGKTKRTLATRIKEHKAACRLTAFERSAVAEHAWQEGHEINWDDVEILDKAKDLQQGKVKEIVHQNGSLNLSDEQRRRKRVISVMDENHQKCTKERL